MAVFDFCVSHLDVSELKKENVFYARYIAPKASGKYSITIAGFPSKSFVIAFQQLLNDARMMKSSILTSTLIYIKPKFSAKSLTGSAQKSFVATLSVNASEFLDCVLFKYATWLPHHLLIVRRTTLLQLRRFRRNQCVRALPRSRRDPPRISIRKSTSTSTQLSATMIDGAARAV